MDGRGITDIRALSAEVEVIPRGHGSALFERGDDEAGPYQSPMEDGMRHFHEWYRQALKPRM